eukprot:jgi/Chlat1/2435/Chrsp17S02680
MQDVRMQSLEVFEYPAGPSPGGPKQQRKSPMDSSMPTPDMAEIQEKIDEMEAGWEVERSRYMARIVSLEAERDAGMWEDQQKDRENGRMKQELEKQAAILQEKMKRALERLTDDMSQRRQKELNLAAKNAAEIVAGLEDKIADLRKQLKEATSARGRGTPKANGAEAEVARLTAQCEKLMEELKAARAGPSAVSEWRIASEGQGVGAGQAAALAALVKSLEQEKEEQASRHAVEMEELRAELESAGKRVTDEDIAKQAEKDQLIHSLQSQLKAQEEAIATLQGELSAVTMTKEVAAQQNAADVAALEARHAADIAAVRHELKAKALDAEGLTEKFRINENEIARLQSLVAAKDATIASLDSQHRSASAGVDGLRATHAAELASLQEQIARREAEARASASDVMAECTSLRQRVAHLEGSRSGLEAELAALKLKYVDVETKWKKEMRDRKSVHNELMNLKGNIRQFALVRVFARVRPVLKDDADRETCIIYPPDTNLGLKVNDGARREQAFTFDRVFDQKATQVAVWEDTAPLVQSCVDGYNVCIFAYGQTGSGKTHTMDGSEQDRGINFRALEELFSLVENLGPDAKSSMSVSMIEIYNETVRDLLTPRPAEGKLEIKHNPLDGRVHVPDLSMRPVVNIKDVEAVFKEGKRNRSTASTNMNQHSSRSHMILTVYLEVENLGQKHKAKLHLVDLAGSERVNKSGVSGDQLKEAQAINKSLSALGDVIASLQKKNSHIPYRNSKLTYLLQDSLGGDAKVLMFANVAPNMSNSAETISSLQFAQRAKLVDLGMAKKNSFNNSINTPDAISPDHSGAASPIRAESPQLKPTGSATRLAFD